MKKLIFIIFYFFCLPVFAGEVLFNLLNKSKQSINGVFISAPEDDSWGKNQAATTLSPDMALVVGRLDSKCVQDVRVTYQNNTEEVLSKVDLCKLKQHDVLGEVLTFNGKTAKPIKIEVNATPSIPTQATGPSLLDCKTVNCADHQAVISAVRSAWSVLRISSNAVAKAYGDSCLEGLKEIQKAPRHMIGDRGFYENFMGACNAGLFELRK
jgi:hypothetical protein